MLNGGFSNFTVYFIFINLHFKVKKSSLIFPICLLIYISMDSWFSILFHGVYNLLLLLLILMLILYQIGQWEFLQVGLCVLLTWLHYFLNTSLFSGITKCPRLILYFTRGIPGISQGPLVPFSGEWYLEAKIYTPGMFDAVGVLLPLGPVSGKN